MKLVEYGLLHFLLYGTCIWLFGFVYGILAIICFFIILDRILPFFNLTRLNFHDYLITFESGSDANHVVCVLFLDKLDTEEFKKHVYERVLTKIQKTRSIRVNWRGFYFWKEIDPKIALTNVFKVDIKPKTEQE